MKKTQLQLVSRLTPSWLILSLLCLSLTLASEPILSAAAASNPSQSDTDLKLVGKIKRASESEVVLQMSDGKTLKLPRAMVPSDLDLHGIQPVSITLTPAQADLIFPLAQFKPRDHKSGFDGDAFVKAPSDDQALFLKETQNLLILIDTEMTSQKTQKSGAILNLLFETAWNEISSKTCEASEEGEACILKTYPGVARPNGSGYTNQQRMVCEIDDAYDAAVSIMPKGCKFECNPALFPDTCAKGYPIAKTCLARWAAQPMVPKGTDPYKNLASILLKDRRPAGPRWLLLHKTIWAVQAFCRGKGPSEAKDPVEVKAACTAYQDHWAKIQAYLGSAGKRVGTVQPTDGGNPPAQSGN